MIKATNMKVLILEKYIRESIHQINEISLKKKIESLSKDSSYGELKTVLNAITASNKTKKGLEVGKNLVGLIPGLDTGDKIATGYDLIKSLCNIKDGDRPKNFLANFDLDDDISQIVDNDLEDDFIKELSARIETISDSKKIGSFNMTDQIRGYLARRFNNRTVTGFSKNKN